MKIIICVDSDKNVFVCDITLTLARIESNIYFYFLAV